MPLKIEVRKPDVTTKTGKRKADGQPYEIREQTAWAYMGDEFPVKVMLSLERDQQPYGAGTYTVADESFRIDTFGKLTIGRLKLQRVAAASAAPAAARA